MSVQSSTPLDVAIHRRDRKHDLAASLSREWMNNNVFATAWFNAMSITFPLGEQFFIESVRHFRDDISDPKLKQEVMNFFSQEGVHRREHQRYNELLCEQRGYDLNALERTARRRQKMDQEKCAGHRTACGNSCNGTHHRSTGRKNIGR